MSIQETIQKAKAKQGFTSELALGQAIGVSGVTVMRWRRKLAIPEPEHAQRLAEIAGIDPAPFVLECLQKSTKDDPLRATINRIKKVWRCSQAALLATATLLEYTANCILCNIVPLGQKPTKMEPSGCHTTA